MSVLRNRWVILSVALLVVALLSSLAAGFYYYQYEDLRSRIAGKLEHLNIGIDYGNTTRIWFNQTEALSGATLFDVTKHIANINYTVESWGTYVTGINGKFAQGENGWTYWMRNGNSTGWELVMEGVDKYVIVGNEVFMWYYGIMFNSPP